jgi:hypothetical protein
VLQVLTVCSKVNGNFSTDGHWDPNANTAKTCFNYQLDAQFLYSVIHILQNKETVHQVGN